MVWISLLVLMLLIAMAPGIAIAVEQWSRPASQDVGEGFHETSRETP